MRIAMVSEHASPLAAVGGVDAGGQNVHVAALARALARQGHEVVVHTRRDDPGLPGRVEVEPGLVVHHVDAGPAEPLPKDRLLGTVPEFSRALVAQWEQERPDVAHAHFWMSGLAALVARRTTGVPVVQTFHALGAVKRRFQGARDTSPPERIRFEKAIARDADAIVATCTDEVAELLRLGADRRRLSVVPCGVDVEHFTEHGPVWPRTDRQRVVTVGRLVERKGVDTLIHALRQLPGTELLVAGGPEAGALGEDAEARRLSALAGRVGVEDRVRLLGRVGRDDLPALLRSADLVACVPWYEPFGMVPLEAMATGRAVVASAVGGLTDTVTDGVTGVLVPPRRPDRLATVLRTLLADPFQLSAYGAAGVDRTHSRYRWERIAAETLAVYSRLLPSPDPAAPGSAGPAAPGVDGDGPAPDVVDLRDADQDLQESLR